MQNDFVTLCALNLAKPEEIDDFIHDWHTFPQVQGLPIEKHLGMTWEQYAEWVKDPDTIYTIVLKRAEELGMWF